MNGSSHRISPVITFPMWWERPEWWTNTWYFRSYILLSGIFCYASKNHFPKVRGSQFCQHGDQDNDWETFFYHLVYHPDLVSNVIYRPSKKTKQTQPKKTKPTIACKFLINKEYLYVNHSLENINSWETVNLLTYSSIQYHC